MDLSIQESSGALIKTDEEFQLNDPPFRIAENGFIMGLPAGSNDPYERIRSTIIVHVTGTSKDDVIANWHTLDHKLWRLQNALKAHFNNSMWLEKRLDGETSKTRAYIYKIERDQSVNMRDLFLQSENLIGQYAFAVEHTWFEQLVPTKKTTTGISTIGGVWDVDHYVNGQTFGRAVRVSIEGNIGGGGPLVKGWIGVRGETYNASSDRSIDGWRDGFFPVWDLAKGTLYNSTSITDPDTQANDNKRITCTFADPSMLPRVTITMLQIVPGPFLGVTSQRGLFHLLLRARCSDATTQARIQLFSGYFDGNVSGNSLHFLDREIVVDNQSYNFYPIGDAQMPILGQDTEGDVAEPMTKTTYQINAERIAGSGDLHLDIIGLVPYSEGYFTFEGGRIESTGGTDVYRAEIHSLPDGTVLGKNLTKAGTPLGTWSNEGTLTAHVHLGVPLRKFNLICFAQRVSESVITDLVDLEMHISERHSFGKGDF